MKLTVKQLTLCAVLTALALALSYMESLFPLPLLIPLPGIKLGLANIVTVFALCTLGAGQAFLILIARCCLGSLFAGNLNTLLFSLMGGLLALALEALLLRINALSLFGVSIGGASAHNCGQVLAAIISLGTPAPLAYLPVLLIAALFTGALTGLIIALLLRASWHLPLFRS